MQLRVLIELDPSLSTVYRGFKVVQHTWTDIEGFVSQITYDINNEIGESIHDMDLIINKVKKFSGASKGSE